MSVIFLIAHLVITSIFIYKYSKEPQKIQQNLQKSTSQLTDISIITSETL